MLLRVLAVITVVHAVDPSSEIVVGNVRVQALSPTLLRIEPKGPRGFEDQPTLSIINRSFSGVPISLLNVSGSTAWVGTKSFKLRITQVAPPSDMCAVTQSSMDVGAPVRSFAYPDGVQVGSQGECCNLCQQDALKEPTAACRAYVYAPSTSGVNCWPLQGFDAAIPTPGRVFGCIEAGCVSPVTSILLTDINDKTLWSLDGPPAPNSNLLHWPSPLKTAVYAFTDYPRFVVPVWGAAPIPANASVDPALVPTNGYDFRNNQNGDSYVFLLGDSLDSWFSSRTEFVQLTGPTPLLPDYAFGTWFTRWHSYTETEAKADISRWQSGKLPLDVWGLDMNWRNTSDQQDRYYDHPNTALFPDFSEWFQYLAQNKLRTYFNDHPFPQDMQTFPKEVDFRWQGLSEWLARGLTFWWFDHNWGFSIPPPNHAPMGGWNVSSTDGIWDGLDNAAWGSHMYYTVVKAFNQNGSRDRPMTLTKFARPDWRAGMDSSLHAETPSHHRYPVWWTGDGVTLQASCESMVDSGVHDFKPFVHSDCGGDYRGTAGDLLRWTAHCVFGTILRFHGDDHRPWTYDAHTEAVILSYLNIRYSQIPSLIAAGAEATKSGFPIVARGDLYWPQYPEAASNLQYIHLNATLVAPIFDSTSNLTTRSVWIPPGRWQDAWNGTILTGPQTVSVTRPFEQQPMWHRIGGLLVTTPNPGTRVDEQDWSELKLEAFPDIFQASSMQTVVVEDDSVTTISMHSSAGSAVVEISGADTARSWIMRVHLPIGNTLQEASLDGEFIHHTVRVPSNSSAFFPFLSLDPAPFAGNIAEFYFPASSSARLFKASIVSL